MGIWRRGKANRLRRKIYFSYALVDLGTEYEEMCVFEIGLKFPDWEIVKSRRLMIGVDRVDSDIKFGRRHGKFVSKKYLDLVREGLGAIDDCDIMVVCRSWNELMLRGKYSKEVLMEAGYGKRIGMKIVELKLWRFGDVGESGGEDITRRVSLDIDTGDAGQK